MSGRKFIDTNVFVYAIAPAAPPKKLNLSRALIRSAIADRDGVVSYQVIQELVNVALRKFTVPVAPADLGDFIDGSFRRMLIVHSSLELFHAALNIQARYRLAWYDSIIVAAAVESGCTTLCSEDLPEGAKYGSVQVTNPFR
jgi:predicted nucleic acid-binding protein